VSDHRYLGVDRSGGRDEDGGEEANEDGDHIVTSLPEPEAEKRPTHCWLRAVFAPVFCVVASHADEFITYTLQYSSTSMITYGT
jgi:hypothetical protein